MNVGQPVMTIATWDEEAWMPPPPIGSVGTISGPLDEGDYLVLFDDYPCPVGEPDWYTPKWAIVPIGDDPDSRRVEMKETLTC
jgi:hypothetical protein